MFIAVVSPVNSCEFVPLEYAIPGAELGALVLAAY